MCDGICFETKKTSRRWVGCWAFFGFLAGSAVFYFSIMLQQADVIKHVEQYIEYMYEYNVRQYLFAAMLTLSIFIILFGILGMMFRWMRNRCCLFFYGSCLLPLWVISIAVGASAMYISYIAADEFEKECDELIEARETRNKRIVFTDQGDNLEINFNIYMDVQTDKYMCTRNCPCEDSRAADWLEGKDAADAAFKYDRGLDRDQQTFQFGPLLGEDFLVSTYLECIERVEENYYATPDFQQFARDWKASPGYQDEVDYLKFFEDKYDCSGICERPLFAFSLPVSDGPPISCFDAIKDDVQKSLFQLGIATLCAGVLMLVLFLCQYCLWRKY